MPALQLQILSRTLKRSLCISSVAILLVTVNLFAQPAIRQISQQYDFWAEALTPAIVGNIALVPTVDTGLRILDISDPNHPTPIGSYNPGIPVHQVAVEGTIAVIVADDERYWDNGDPPELQVLDISDPAQTTLLSRIEIDYDEGWRFYPEHGMRIVDQKFCMIDHRMMVVVDLVNPRQPREIFRTTAEQYWDFDIRDDYIFVGSRDTLGVASLKIFDYSNFEPVSTLEFGWLAADILLSGSYAYVETEDDWAVVSISNPREPYEVARLGEIWRVDEYPMIATDEIIVTVFYDSLRIYNIEDPIIPRRCGSVKFDEISDLHPVFVGDNLLAVSQGWYGFSMVDISDWENPVELGSYPPEGRVRDIAVLGAYAYVALGSPGIDVWNVSEPAHPRLVTHNKFDQPVSEFLLYGDALYIVDYNVYGQMIADLSTPYRPRLINTGDSITTQGIVIGNGLLATYGHSREYEASEIRLFDLVDPLAPNYVGECPVENYVSGIGLTNHYLIASDRGFEGMDDDFGYIYSYDVSDPRNPVLVDSLHTNRQLYNLVVGENFAYMSYYDGDWENQIDKYGIYVIGISDEGELVILNEIETDGRGFQDAKIVGDRLIFGRWGCFSIWDIGDPAYPEPLVDYEKTSYVRGVSYRNGMIYTAEEYNFCIYDCSDFLEVPPENPFILQPSSLSLSAFPNPFNSSTTISYSLPSPGRYAIDVIDIQGRLVTRLSDGWREAGSYREVLNGGGLTSGQYVIKLNSNTESFSRPVTIIK